MNTRLFIVILLYTLSSFDCQSQEKTKMQVWLKEGSMYQFETENIDSITFVEEEQINGGTHGVLDGHEWVDLGLPSGTLWATCNVGANTPDEYGDYFAWGETTPKEVYNWSTYNHAYYRKNRNII